MTRKTKEKRGCKWTGLLPILLIFSLLLGGCGTGGGSDSYDTPESATNAALPGNNTNVLISAATLKSWMDAGLVNSQGFNTNKVVIIDYGSYKFDGTDNPRIPGACRVTANDLRATRQEGVAPAASLVATGEQMDAVIQEFGIDANTIIVLTSDNLASAKNFYSSRAYFTFRYWGFPKACLRVLDGGNKAWQDAGYALTDAAPTPIPSTFSVRNLDGINSGLRYSISEMIQMVESGQNGNSYLSIDARGATYFNGGTPYVDESNKGAQSSGYLDVINADPLARKVAFEGHMEGGKYLSWSSLYNADGTFLTADAIQAQLEAIGWTPSTTVISYCLSGYSGSPMFFVVDAIMDQPVALYDGSWSQWGKLCTVVVDVNADGVDDETGCMLPAEFSSWATDVLTWSGIAGGPIYNAVASPDGNNLVIGKIEPLDVDPFLNPSIFTPANPDANQVEQEDADYQSVAPSGGGSSSSEPPSSSGGAVDGGC